MHKLILSTVLSLCYLTLAAQTQPPLQVGDTIPADFSFGKIINYNQPSLSYSDLSGKAIILDFWASWCGPCISELETLDSLQTHFGNQIVILPINQGETQNEIIKSLKKNKIQRLPSIYENQQLLAMFPHRIIPHVVWIGTNRVIKSITSGEEVNQTHIESLISGTLPILTQKKDITDFEPDKPLFVNGNGGNGDNFISRTILTNKIDGIGAFTYTPRESNSMVKNFFSANVTPIQLFYKAFTMSRNISIININCIFIDNNGKESQLTNEEFEKYVASEKTYCYNMNLPDPISDSIFFRKYFMDDLNKYFNIKGEIKNKKTRCWVITKNKKNKGDLLLSDKNQLPKDIYLEGHGILQKIYHRPFREIIDRLRTYPDTPPIVNKSGYSNELVDMELNLKWQKDDAWNKTLDFQAVKTALNKYGLDITEMFDTPAEVLIISRK